RFAADTHLYRPSRAQGSGQGIARNRAQQAAAELRLGRARAERCTETVRGARRALSPRNQGQARPDARSRGAAEARAVVLRFRECTRGPRSRWVDRRRCFRSLTWRANPSPPQGTPLAVRTLRLMSAPALLYWQSRYSSFSPIRPASSTSSPLSRPNRR